jgi:protein-tyrosine phosphatase
VIDVHCHILPAVDDGPKTLDESLEMARIAASDGIDTIICTPHYGTLRRGDQPADIVERVRDFQAAVSGAGIPLTVLPGAELVLTKEIGSIADNGLLITLNNSKYVLVEIPFDHYPPGTDEALFQLQTRGYQPIFAHPERQRQIQQKPEVLGQLVDRGIFAQVTALSMNGGFGNHAKAAAETLTRRGLVHILSSDAHVADGPRKPSLAAAKQRIGDLVGEDRAEGMAFHLPGAISRNEDFDLAEPQVRESGGFWRRLIGGRS